MSYFYDAFDEYVIMNRAVEDDGEGGTITQWKEGAKIKMALDLGRSSEVRAAMAQGLKTVFTATFPKDTPVKYGDYVKAVDGGEVYRITSAPSDNGTPPGATYQSLYATAIREELPT